MRLLWAIVWKEWLGLRWKLAALIAIPVGCQLCLLVVDPTLLPTSHATLFVAFGAVAPIFLAMHAAAEDNSAGTLEFVRGLPVPLFQFGLIRILATLVVLLVPVVAASLVASFTVWIMQSIAAWLPFGPGFAAIAQNSGPVPEVLVATAATMAVSASLYLWTTALAMNQPSELRAGMIGVATAVVWAAWTLFTIAQWDNGPGNWTWLYGITALGPFAGLVMFDPGLSFAGRIAMGLGNVAGMCTLLVIAARRYGILERRGPRSLLQFSSPHRALWWMQLRQTWPLGAAGLATVLGLSMVRLALSSGDPHHDDFVRYDAILYEWSIGVGALWAIVVAAPLFTAELEPKLAAFWRSRPIDPADWFRIKYLTGALTLLIFIDLPAAWLGQPLDTPKAESVVAYLACVPALHLAFYSLAVLIACLIRNAIYAGILTMGAAPFIIVLPMTARPEGLLGPLRLERVMRELAFATATGQFDRWLLSLGVFLTFTLSIAVTTTLLARRAVQKDVAVRV
jgi:hypothetical protein